MAALIVLVDYCLIMLSFCVGLPLILIIALVFRIVTHFDCNSFKKRKLLSIWTAHSYKSIKTYGHEQLVLQQNSTNFFDHVYTFYPILGANPLDCAESFKGITRSFDFANGHTFIEAKMKFIRVLWLFPRTNILWSQIYLIFIVLRIIKKEQIALVRGWDPFLTGLYCCLLSMVTAKPFYLRIGSNYDLLHQKGTTISKKLFKSYAIEKLIARFVFRKASLVLAANQNYLEYCIQNGARKDCIALTRFGNMIDAVHLTEPSSRLKIEGDLPFIGKPFGVYVGRLTKVKHAEDLLFVVKEAKNKNENIAIVCIGDGDLTQELINRAIAMGISESIFFLGKQNQDWIARLLPMATVYLAPHSGRALVEAAYAGLPLVAYDWEWHAEIVIPGVTGELVPYRDWKKMASVFVDIVNNKDYAMKMGKNARKMAMEIMDQKKIQEIEKDKIQTIYNKYISRH